MRTHLHQHLTLYWFMGRASLGEALRIGEPVAGLTHDHCRGLDAHLNRESSRAVAAHVEPSALAHGDHLQRRDFAEFVSFDIDHTPRSELDAIAQERLSSLRLRDEAHILTLRFVGRAQSKFSCKSSHLGLCLVSHREDAVAELRLIEHVQHIGLILGCVFTAGEKTFARLVHEANVVSGGERIETQNVSTFKQTIKLQMPVTFHTGVRRETGRMSLDVRFDNLLVKIV